MALAERLATKKPKTPAELYTAWLDGLPATEREAVTAALRDRRTWPHKDLHRILESDEDHPAPEFAVTTFGRWRNETFA